MRRNKNIGQTKQLLMRYREHLKKKGPLPDMEKKLQCWESAQCSTGRTESRQVQAIKLRYLDLSNPSVEDIAKSMGVSRASAYRYIADGWQSLAKYLGVMQKEELV